MVMAYGKPSDRDTFSGRCVIAEKELILSGAGRHTEKVQEINYRSM